MKKQCKICKYFWNILISIDQLVNTILGGDPDETISSRAGKRVNTQKWAYYLCRILHLLDPDHCNKSIEEDTGSRQVLDD